MKSSKLKGKIEVAELTATESKSYLGYLNKLVDDYNNTCHCSIKTEPVDDYYSALTEEIEKNPEVPKFKFCNRVRVTNYKDIFRKDSIEKWSRYIFVSVLKTSPRAYKIKSLNGKKITSFIINNFCWVN